MDRVEYLLSSAITLKNAPLRSKKVPKTFESFAIGKKTMINVLLHEAREAFETPIEVPANPYLHSVDVDTEEPGIVDSKESVNVVRKKLPCSTINYHAVHQVPPPTLTPNETPPKLPKTLEAATAKALKQEAAALVSQEKKAKRDEERVNAKEERKRLLENETSEEKAIRIAEEKAVREEKRLKREEKKKNEVPKERVSKTVNEDVLTTEAVDKVLPASVRKRTSKMHFFENPVPHDRHLIALQHCNPNPSIAKVLTSCRPTEVFTLFHGPPGCGKTRALIEEVKRFPNARVFLTAPTNVGTANLYVKCIESGLKDVSLILPKERIPVGTPVMNVDPSARIVCSTISGRNGPFLMHESFEVVLIDEAAQTMEAWIWGLMRSDVEHVCLAGDPKQLSPHVCESGKPLNHGMSLFQRLLDADYPCTFLNVQNRMHPEISKLPNEMFYQNSLTDGPKVDTKTKQAFQFLHVNGVEKECLSSFANSTEAESVASIVEQLKADFHQVVVITPYSAQASLLMRYQMGVPIHTVDSFQGKEADAIVLCMVRTSNIGFWSDARRLNVALTRAKKKLVVVGNGESWSEYPLKELYEDAKRRKLVIK